MSDYPEDFLKKLRSVKAKRPATVIRHMLEHGYVTTEELEKIYGYRHPPRAIRDVRELGIPVETFHVKSSDGRTIAAYRFGNPSASFDRLSKASGRTAFSKSLKKALISKYGSECFVYLQPMEEHLLQVDHRVPYEIGGEQDENDLDCYMLLSPSANRAKSWACEHCPNWKVRNASFCMKCFWAHPESYTHVAGKEQRQITIVFTGEEIADYDMLIKLVGHDKAEQTIKDLIENFVGK